MSECCTNEEYLFANGHTAGAVPIRVTDGPVPHDGVLRAMAQKLGRALQRRRQRRELLRLDEHILHDIGLTPADVERITGRDFHARRDPLHDDPARRLHHIHFHR